MPHGHSSEGLLAGYQNDGAKSGSPCTARRCGLRCERELLVADPTYGAWGLAADMFSRQDVNASSASARADHRCQECVEHPASTR